MSPLIPFTMMVVGAGLLFDNGIFIGLMLIAGGAYLYHRHAKYKPIYEENMALYNRLWICTDSGHVYEVDN